MRRSGAPAPSLLSDEARAVMEECPGRVKNAGAGTMEAALRYLTLRSERAPISGLPEIGIINFASRQQPTCVRVSLEGSVRNAQASSLETRRTKCAAPQSLTQKETNEIKLSHLAPSCPVLCWASTPLLQRQQKDVDGRDKPGHDGEDTAQRTPSANTNPPSTRKEFKSFRCFP